MIVKKLNMNKEDILFSKNRLIIAHRRDWEMALEWYAVFLPREKLLVQAFLKEVQPVVRERGPLHHGRMGYKLVSKSD